MGIRSNLHSVHLVLLCPEKCCWYWEAIFKHPLCHCCSIYGISLDCRFLLRVTLIQRQSHSLVLAGRCLRMSLAQPPAESWIDTKVRPSCLQLFPLGCCGGLTLARDKLPHSCSLTSQQDTMGKKNPQNQRPEILWIEIKKGRSHICYCHGKRRLKPRQLIYCVLK